MDLADYMDLPYRTEVHPDMCGDTPCFFATHPELPGCSGMGFTWQEAVADLVEARRGYIETRLSRGWDIPLPEYKLPILKGVIHVRQVNKRTPVPSGSLVEFTTQAA